MTDLTSLSDADLMTMLQAPPAAPAGLSAMSDADLMAALGKPPEPIAAPDERPWYQKLGSAADDIVRLGANAMTLGLADRLAGAAGGEGLAAEQQKTQGARERAGGAGLVTEIGGTMLPAGALMKGVSAAVPAIGQMTGGLGLAARTGSMAGQGAALGATEALIGDKDVGTGAAIGALAGGAGNLAGEAIAKGVGKIAGAFNKKPVIPDADAIKSASKDAYARSEAAGVIVRPEPLKRFATEVQKDLAEFGYLPALQPKVGTVLQEIERVGTGNTTLKGIDQLRKVAGTLRADQDASTRAIGAKVVEKLDDFISNMKATDILAGNKTEGVLAIQEARKLHQMARKSEIIDEAVERATNNAAASGSGGNADNAVRQQFRSILNDPKKRRGFSSDEIAAVREIVRGTATQNTLRLLGKLSPQGNGLMAALGIGATAVNPLMAIPSVVGLAVKPIADRATGNNVQRLADIIRSGGSLPPPTYNSVQRLAASQREPLVSLLMSGGLAGNRE